MRLLHTMLRVGDMQRSIDFYTEVDGHAIAANNRPPGSKVFTCIRGLCR